MKEDFGGSRFHALTGRKECGNLSNHLFMNKRKDGRLDNIVWYNFLSKNILGT